MDGPGSPMVELTPDRHAAFAPGQRAPVRVALTTTSWSPHAELESHEWADQGRRLGVVGRAVGWWVGDWLRYGNERFGERYVRAARITGYDVQTLMNMVYVASRFEPARRHEHLSFSHHAELAALEPEAQDAWLEQAEAERLSVRCLREEVRRARTREAEAAEPELERHAPPEREVVCCPECGCHFERERLERDAATGAVHGPA
jgi:hypothetical protein